MARDVQQTLSVPCVTKAGSVPRGSIALVPGQDDLLSPVRVDIGHGRSTTALGHWRVVHADVPVSVFEDHVHRIGADQEPTPADPLAWSDLPDAVVASA
jgi:hypothetical protein